MRLLRAICVPWLSSVCLCLAAAIPGGCASAPLGNLSRINNEELAQDFPQLRVVDIAILPVKDEAGAADGIPPMVREEIKKTLVAKMFSPLSFESVDRKLGPLPEKRSFDPAGLKGSFDEDAILTATLTQWEGQWLRTHNKALIGATFSLFHSPSGKVVWVREIRNQYVEVSGRVTAENVRDYQSDAIRSFVRDAMRNVPRKAFRGDLEETARD